MPANHIDLLNEKEINKSFEKIEQMLSSQKARECLKNIEAELAFDIEVYLQPLRKDLGDCLDLVADMTRERGTSGKEIQRAIPVLSDYLDPASNLARSLVDVEKRIAEKKRNHPDFVMAFKLQVLVKRFEETLKQHERYSPEYNEIQRKLENTKATLADHTQNKLRIAQRSLAPDLLEMAQWQLEMSRHREKVLRIKKGLLDAGRKHSEGILRKMASVFRETEPELADTILMQTQSVMATGELPANPGQKPLPKNLAEYREEIQAQSNRLMSFDNRLKSCMEQLHKLMAFEQAIFNTYGEKLRERGIQFEKKPKIEKSGTGIGINKPRQGTRMVSRHGKR